MFSIDMMADDYHKVGEDSRYAVNFAILRKSCYNLFRVLELPERLIFNKYFLCDKIERNFKLASIFRLRNSYKKFLAGDVSGFRRLENFIELESYCRDRSPIERFIYIQAYFEHSYKMPIILTEDILKTGNLDDNFLGQALWETAEIVDNIYKRRVIINL